MKNFFKEERAITLVALIITIIILLILVTISINLAINGGIILKAQNAVEKYQVAEDKEQIQLGYNDYKLALSNGQQENLNVEGATVTGNEVNGWTISFNHNGNNYLLDKNGNISTVSSNDNENNNDNGAEIGDGETIIQFNYSDILDQYTSTCTFNTSKANNVQIITNGEASQFYNDFMQDCRSSQGDLSEIFPMTVLEKLPDDFNNMAEMEFFLLNNYEARYGNALFDIYFSTPYEEGETIYVIFKYHDTSLEDECGYIVVSGQGLQNGNISFEMSADDLETINNKDAAICIISQQPT